MARPESNAPAQATSPEPASISHDALATIIKEAVETIGNREKASHWLATPVRALGYATPISLLHNKEGGQQVLTVLARLRHGVL